MRGRSGAREWLASPQQEECSLCFVVSASGVRQLGTQGEGFKKQGGGESHGNIHHRPPTNPKAAVSTYHRQERGGRDKKVEGRTKQRLRCVVAVLLRGSAESEREGAAHAQMPQKALQSSSPAQSKTPKPRPKPGEPQRHRWGVQSVVLSVLDEERG